MTNNFDNTAFYLDPAGLELSLADFAFDATQASQVQQHLQQQQHQQQLLHQQHQHQQHQQKQQHQQEQQKLQNLLLRDDPSSSSETQSNNNSNNNKNNNDTSSSTVTTSSGPYDFRPAMTMEMMNPTGTGSASTTPVFQTHPDKINNTNNSNGNANQAAASLQQLQQQHQQQQLLLQQQQQQQQQHLRQQQQQQLQQLPQTQAQLQAQAQVQSHHAQAHHQNKDGSVRQNLLKSNGSDYYAGADYSQYQYISPLGMQPDTNVETTMTMPEQFEEEAADSGEQLRPMTFTPMLSPELTPANPYPNLPQSMPSGDRFTPLTSPAIGPHRTSQMDYISFSSGQGFSALPMQFQQAHQIQQQQLQNFQAQQQQQQQFLSNDAQQQQQQQQQQQVHQGIGTKHARAEANGQRPGLKRRPTAEHSTAANGVGPRNSGSITGTAAAVSASMAASNVGGVGSIRVMSKSSPALGPLSSTPLSPAGARKPVVSAGTSRTSRPVSLVPGSASPMGMQFSGSAHRITPSPIMTSTINNNNTSVPQSQPSPSPHLVGGMNQLSMMPVSPAMFSLPASSMMPPPINLPQQQTQNHTQTHRQLQISHPVQIQQQQQQQYQLSIHQPQQLQQQQQQQPQHNHFAPIGSMLRPTGSVNVSAAPLTAAQAAIVSAPVHIAATTATTSMPAMTASIEMVMSQAHNTASPSMNGTFTPKMALAPVTPGLLMNLSGSGSESTPTSSPKSVSNNKNANAAIAIAANNNNVNGNPSPSSSSSTLSATTTSTKSTRSIAAKSTEKSKAPAAGSSSRSSSGGSKRNGGGSGKSKGSTNAGVLAPRTPGTTATAVISSMPAGGFASLISPALKPTLMPQPPLHHRGSLSGQPILVSTARGQSLLVSPSLKPWLPGVSTSEAMARLASKSNYQNILDGDHTALGLSYNTDLHSGIELRRTSHKAAEQKRRDSLKHCFDDLRHMIPNIVDKAPSKVFLLKKSFDYICSLRAEMAQRDLTIARMQAQQEFFQQACRQWFESGGGGVPDMEGWKMSEEMLDQATRRELEVAQITAEMAEQSAAAVEAARIGNQPGGGNGGSKDGKNSASGGSKTVNGVATSQVNGSSTSAINGQHQHQRQNASSKDESDDDEDDDSTPTASRRCSTTTTGTISIALSSTSSSASSTSSSTPTIHPLSGPSSSDIHMTSAFNASSSSSSGATQKQRQHIRSRSSRSDDEDEEDEDDEEEGDDEDDEDYEGDQEMRSVQ
ncbi:hypothetical protein BGZ96_007176 [Linnemannia gamsii]|uniref:BHLH domain-containing protein n=1 Tax=Linnemannia gamsii TaxID=64522 RepID=A0ABQ7K1F1_9FUNG|nr:hypothetical protein BGZ96_007176 [Linnemannia gamsii]